MSDNMHISLDGESAANYIDFLADERVGKKLGPIRERVEILKKLIFNHGCFSTDRPDITIERVVQELAEITNL